MPTSVRQRLLIHFMRTRAPSASRTRAAIPLDCVVSGGRAAIPFDYVVLGGRAPELMVTHDRAVALVREFADKGKVVANHRRHCNMHKQNSIYF